MSATEVIDSIMITTTPPTMMPMTRIMSGSSSVVTRCTQPEKASRLRRAISLNTRPSSPLSSPTSSSEA